MLRSTVFLLVVAEASHINYGQEAMTPNLSNQELNVQSTTETNAVSMDKKEKMSPPGES